MISVIKQGDEYQLGGSLPEEAPSYIVRKADFDFYQALKEGMLCSVMNSRQMGKSSLQVRTISELKQEGFACVAFDMTELCVNNVTEDEFYSGFVSHLASELNLDIDLQDWWYKHSFIQPCLRLSKFFEEVLLQLPQDIVIFLDEIDNLLNFSFKDDFMAFIRSCYHKRIEKRSLNRLTFALLGTATIEELFQDKDYRNDTYFQMQHRAIELTGFQLHEVEPLQIPLTRVADNPSAVMQEILSWTGGQPFLTQWICQLICNSGLQIAQGEEADTVSWIVRSHIIDNWLLRDKLQYFYTIKDRIINNKIPAYKLLQLYQNILHYENISADGSPEVLQLCLSGLVKECDGKLEVYNRIFKSVFDDIWVAKQLEECLKSIR
ncbi:MAG: AAA-like domain-containing protein [Rivularia sp. ALOHA_DT_140]|nr:AAA-like domain-containing protein [Rivularia sp. ALOHA_DT_140]